MQKSTLLFITFLRVCIVLNRDGIENVIRSRLLAQVAEPLEENSKAVVSLQKTSTSDFYLYEQMLVRNRHGSYNADDFGKH